MKKNQRVKKTVKMVKVNVNVMPMTEEENRQVMNYATKWLRPIKKEEIEQVELNEEFGLAGKMMLTLLFQWLSEENQKSMMRLLQFYHPLDKAVMIYAVLLYLQTGRLLKLKSAVAQLHYDLMVGYVDEDMVTLPSHNHLMRLYRKYGIFQPIED